MTRTYDPEDPQQVSEQQMAQDLAKQQSDADWAWILAAPQGRRVLATLIMQSGYLEASYVPGDALGTAFREGMREMGRLTYSVARSVGQGAITALMAEVMSAPDASRSNAARRAKRTEG